MYPPSNCLGNVAAAAAAAAAVSDDGEGDIESTDVFSPGGGCSFPFAGDPFSPASVPHPLPDRLITPKLSGERLEPRCAVSLSPSAPTTLGAFSEEGRRPGRYLRGFLSGRGVVREEGELCHSRDDDDEAAAPVAAFPPMIALGPGRLERLSDAVGGGGSSSWPWSWCWYRWLWCSFCWLTMPWPKKPDVLLFEILGGGTSALRLKGRGFHRVATLG